MAVEFDMFPDAAVIIVSPTATVAANPFEPSLLLMVATAGVDELQITESVTSCCEPSEKLPVAVNCSVAPAKTLGFNGVTAIDTSVAKVTCRLAEFDMLPDIAVIVVVPAAKADAFPAASIVATEPVDEVQMTDVVISV